MEIKNIRINAELSQNKFAERFQIPLRTLQNWEQGHRECPPYVIYMIKRIIELEATNQ